MTAPNLSQKLASALCIILEIPHEHAKLMHEDQINSLVEWDHYPIRRADGGSNHPSNLRPLLIGAHREKTYKHDAPDMAKERDVRKARSLHEARMNEKSWREANDWVMSRLSPRSRKRIQSRGFNKAMTRGVNGKVRKRKARR